LNTQSSTTQRSGKRLAWRLLAAITATALIGTVMFVNMSVVLAAKPTSSAAVNLDQCRNGGLVTSGTQTFVQCSGGGNGNDGWVNGNAGASNAHYAEGESISYRARITGLNVNDAVTLIMGYDVVHGGVHALDYLTSDNRWQSPETTVAATGDDPCSGVSGCSGAGLPLAITSPTPNIQVNPSATLASGNCEKTGTGATQQPVTSYNSVNGAGEEKMQFFGATPSAFAYVGPVPNLLDRNGDEEQQVQVTFVANSANPVLAWGAHIARAADWGCLGAPQSASGISGSPYHMRIKSIVVNGTPISLGNQDRSLSAAAVVVLQPSLPTTPTGNNGSIGTILNDTATITGGTANPGGSVTFNLYGPNDTSCSGSVIYTQDVLVSGGTATTTPGFTTVAAGTYEWTAHYSGDNNNLPADSACGAEAVVISPNTVTIATTLSATTGKIGDTIHDSSALTGATGTAGGTVTYTVYTDSACSLGAQTAGTVNVTNGVVPDSNGIQFNSAGTWYWQATYSGDANNNNSVPVSSACQSEILVISPNSPTAATTQNLIPNDTLTLTGATSNAGGTVDFYLFAPSVTCGAENIANAAFAQEDVALISNNHASTTNTGSGTGMYLATTVGTYHWLAIYGGDGNNHSVASTCTETFTIIN
jgi:hypothetical protein